MRTFTALQAFWKDLRLASRTLGKNPGFAAVAVITLALGIGASTAIFTIVNGLLIQPLPYQDSKSIVVLSTIFQRTNSDRGSVAYSDVLDWKAQQHLFSAVTAVSPAQFDITGGEGAERVPGLWVESDYFRVVTDTPVVGRGFTVEEDQPGANRVAMLSESAWIRRYGGDPGTVGKDIEIAGEMHRIVGVVSRPLGEKTEIYKPLALGTKPSADAMRRDNHQFLALGRLKPGVFLERAQSELTVMGARVAREHTNRSQTNWKIHRLRDYLIGPTLARLLWILLAAVLLVLLIACVNVANLLLARGAARQHEVGIRVALGAGWQRLTTHFAAESVVLALLGGGVGLVLGIVGYKLMLRYAPMGVPLATDIGVDGAVLAFAGVVCCGTAILFGLAPLWQVLRQAPVASVREAGRSLSGGAGMRRFRSALVVAELALAVILLSGAGLLVRSFLRLQQVEPGFATENRLTLRLELPRSRYAAGDPTIEAFKTILDYVRRLPGVVSVAGSSALPGGGGGLYLGRVFLREGQPDPPASTDTGAQWAVVQPGFLKTMGIPLLAGRDISEADAAASNPVILVSRSMAKEMFGEENPLGRRIRSWRDENKYREIVGVVGDVRYFGVGEDQVNNVYVPHAQNPWRGLFLVVHTSREAGGSSSADVRSAMASYDPRLAVSEVRTIEDILAQSLARQRFAMYLLSAFAVTALLMSAIGIYGLMAYAVSQQTREIGIRMALGALRGDVLRRVTSRAAALASMGAVLGLGGAALLTRWMKALLFGVGPTDVATLTGAALVLICVAMLAAYVPARRASKVDPLTALRYE